MTPRPDGGAALDALLHEARTFPPPPTLAAEALATEAI